MRHKASIWEKIGSVLFPQPSKFEKEQRIRERILEDIKALSENGVTRDHGIEHIVVALADVWTNDDLAMRDLKEHLRYSVSSNFWEIGQVRRQFSGFKKDEPYANICSKCDPSVRLIDPLFLGDGVCNKCGKGGEVCDPVLLDLYQGMGLTAEFVHANLPRLRATGTLHCAQRTMREIGEAIRKALELECDVDGNMKSMEVKSKYPALRVVGEDG